MKTLLTFIILNLILILHADDRPLQKKEEAKQEQQEYEELKESIEEEHDELEIQWEQVLPMEPTMVLPGRQEEIRKREQWENKHPTM